LLCGFALNNAANGVYEKINFQLVYVNISDEKFSFAKRNGVWVLMDNAKVICRADERVDRSLHEITRWCFIPPGGMVRPIRLTITPKKWSCDPPEREPCLTKESTCRSESTPSEPTREQPSEPFLVTHALASQDRAVAEPRVATASSSEDVMDACNAVILQFQQAPALRQAMEYRNYLQGQLAALKASTANSNFRRIARTGVACKGVIETVRQQPLSEELYWTLADRLVAVLQMSTAACKQLAEAEDYDAVTVLGAKLKELKALDVSDLPPPGSTPPSHGTGCASSRPADVSAVVHQCDDLAAQCRQAAHTRAAIERRDALQRELAALKVAESDFEAVGRTGTALKAAIAEVTQLPLSAEDVVALAVRHADQVQGLVDQCTALVDAEDYDALAVLAIKLEE
jgi:hypothetical protein